MECPKDPLRKESYDSFEFGFINTYIDRVNVMNVFIHGTLKHGTNTRRTND